MKINWGGAIAIFYTLFVIAMVSMVIKSTHHKAQMVQDNYYEHDLNYEEFRKKRENGMRVADHVQINYSNAERQIKISLPGNNENISGHLTLFRPNNQKMDLSYPIALDANNEMILTMDDKIAKGRWKVQVDWKNETTSFYNESEIIL